MKNLPWILALILLGGAAFLYSANRKQTTELAALREENRTLQELKASVEEAKTAKTQSENDELVRLRKDNEDLLRLRNETRQLRDQNQQLQKQVQTAQTQAQNAQSAVENAKAQMQTIQSQAQTAQAQADAIRLRAQQAGVNLDPTAACINNLRQLDAAKQQWALERQKTPGAMINPAEVLTYIKGGQMPVCPAGGVYSWNAVGTAPTCSVAGHTLGR
jgi:hypothetical protein